MAEIVIETRTRRITRDQVAAVFKNNPRAVKLFESLIFDVSDTLPVATGDAATAAADAAQAATSASALATSASAAAASAASQASTAAAQAAAALAAVESMQIPVGGIFTTTDPVNPGTTLGYGTWEAFAAGRVLVGVDPSDPDFATVMQTGGAKYQPIPH